MGRLTPTEFHEPEFDSKLDPPIWQPNVCDATILSDTMRTFASGATRNTDTDKLDYEGFLSPYVLERYAKYLHKHRIQADGKLRASNNWAKGIPKDVYIKSLFRHFMDLWKAHKAAVTGDSLEDSLCGVLFNTQGYLFEVLHEQNPTKYPR
jgi:hypothetical protein